MDNDRYLLVKSKLLLQAVYNSACTYSSGQKYLPGRFFVDFSSYSGLQNGSKC